MFRRFRSPELHSFRKEHNVDFLVPIGLQQFTEKFIFPIISQLDPARGHSRIRVIPVPTWQGGSTAAFYDPHKDYVQVQVAMNDFRLFLSQRALAIQDAFIPELRFRLEALTDEALQSAKSSKQHIEWRLEKEPKKPLYRPETEEQYQLNTNFEVIETAFDIYTHFALAFSEAPEALLSDQDNQAIREFIKFIEEKLLAITSDELSSNLEKRQLFPSSYLLFCAMSKVKPNNPEFSISFIKTIQVFTTHELIHQIFHKSFSTVLNETIQPAPDEPEPVYQERNQEEKEALYYISLKREKEVYELVTQIQSNQIPFDEGIKRLRAINLDTLSDVFANQPHQFRKRYFYRTAIVGMEETLLSLLLSADPNNHSFLDTLESYFYDYNCLIPSSTVIEEIRQVIQGHQNDLPQLIQLFITRFFNVDFISKIVSETESRLNSLPHSAPPAS